MAFFKNLWMPTKAGFLFNDIALKLICAGRFVRYSPRTAGT